MNNNKKNNNSNSLKFPIIFLKNIKYFKNDKSYQNHVSLLKLLNIDIDIYKKIIKHY